MTVILNAAAGTRAATKIADEIRARFSEFKVEPKIKFPRGDVVAQARDAMQSSNDMIVAAGGDGTVSAVASVMIDSGRQLGVLPLGTLNHFAKDLSIPLDLGGAVDNLFKGEPLDVDVGAVNSRIFVNNASMGLYPEALRARRSFRQRLGHGKIRTFIWTTLAMLRRSPFLDVRLLVQGKEMRRRTPVIFVGNNQYEMEGLKIGGRRSLTGGKLSLWLTTRTTRMELLFLALRALVGRLKSAGDFEALSVTDFAVHTRHKTMRVALDGELNWMKPPLHFRSRPASLRVIVPKKT